jgi:Xaa-Pro aminopeptidase
MGLRKWLTVLLVATFAIGGISWAQEARRRWERMNQIRRDKFDLVLPQVMRENGIDMWITMIREANYKTLHPDLGHGYTMTAGYYVFTDRGGERIERAALGIDGNRLEHSGAYDIFEASEKLADFVRERDPERIGLNMSRSLGPADTLSHTGFEQIVETLGEPYASRIVSAEKLLSDFRSRRVAAELAAFAEAGEMSRNIAERALSNEVVSPGVTTLEDVAWWMMDRLLDDGLDTSFGLPSVYVTGPDGIAAVSTDRIIQRGDVIMIDWGVGYLNLYTDMKRMAYVLREGETQAPAGLQHAFDKAREARRIVANTIRAGVKAAEAEGTIYAALAEAGFRRIEFNKPTDDADSTDIVIGCHSVGNSGHGIGPSIAFFNPVRLQYELRPSNLLSIELFAYTSMPEWNGKKVRIPLEDDAVLTERGIEWLYPANERILLVR